MARTSTGLLDAGETAYPTPGNASPGLVARAFAWIAEQRRINRTVATLSNLSDHTLKDIGIERGNIERIARYGRDASQTGR
jgi:uncharacterized protein YjiS (DUF1127 family)